MQRTPSRQIYPGTTRALLSCVAMVVGRVLVTGGSGFVGGRVVQHLREQHPECKITILDARIPCTPDQSQPGVEYVEADITSAEGLRAVFAKCSEPFQVVIHCAGICPALADRYGRRIEDLVFKVNLDGTRNVLEVSKSMGVETLVFTSSVCVVTDNFSRRYPNIDERWPTAERGEATPYGESKAAAERLVLAANSATFKTCALRSAVIFGEGDYQLVPNIISCVAKNESPYCIGDRSNMWDVVYVGNVADAHVLAVQNLTSENPIAAGEAIFIHNNEPVSSRDFMLQIWKLYNGHVPPFEVSIPSQLVWLVGLCGNFWTWVTGKSTTISSGSMNDATAMRYCKGEKATELLGYVPRFGLEDSLAKSVQWIVATGQVARR